MPASEHYVQMSSSSEAKEEEQCRDIQGDLQASSSHCMLHRNCLPELKAVKCLIGEVSDSDASPTATAAARADRSWGKPCRPLRLERAVLHLCPAQHFVHWVRLKTF